MSTSLLLYDHSPPTTASEDAYWSDMTARAKSQLEAIKTNEVEGIVVRYDLGLVLRDARARNDRKFQAWVKSELGLNIKTAENYVALANLIGSMEPRLFQAVQLRQLYGLGRLEQPCIEDLQSAAREGRLGEHAAVSPPKRLGGRKESNDAAKSAADLLSQISPLDRLRFFSAVKKTTLRRLIFEFDEEGHRKSVEAATPTAPTVSSAHTKRSHKKKIPVAPPTAFSQDS